MTTDLSPAAQAVLDASKGVYWRPLIDAPALQNKSIAAAIRAAADQVVPYEELKGSHPEAWERDDIRSQLLAISDELEAP